MRAMVLAKQGEPLVLRDLLQPDPGQGELLLRVTACGICRTDLHVVDGDLTEPALPPWATPAMSNVWSPGLTSPPGSNSISVEAILAPSTRALHRSDIANTPDRCWGINPGLVRCARISFMENGFPVSADSARAVLSIWPPPSP